MNKTNNDVIEQRANDVMMRIEFCGVKV